MPPMELTPSHHDLRMRAPWTLGPRWGAALLLILCPALLVLEWVAGNGFSLSLFYVLPVALAAWNFGYRAGLAIAAVSAAYCIFVALATRAPAAALSPIAWQAATTLILYAFIACAVAGHRRFIDGAVRLARVDPESGALANHEFERVLEAEVRRAKRYSRPLAVVLLDASGAKHAQGNSREFLTALAATLRANLREGDMVARIGIRKFGLLMIECPAAEASQAIQRAREAVERKFDSRMSFSFGVVSYGGAGAANASHLMHQAESQVNVVKTGTGRGIAEALLA